MFTSSQVFLLRDHSHITSARFYGVFPTPSPPTASIYMAIHISNPRPLLKSGLKILASGTKGGLEKFRGTFAYQVTYFCWGQVLERSNLMISKSLDTFHNLIIFIVFVDLHWYNIGTYYVLSECVSVSEVICQYISIAKRIQNLCKQNRQLYDTPM